MFDALGTWVTRTGDAHPRLRWPLIILNGLLIFALADLLLLFFAFVVVGAPLRALDWMFGERLYLAIGWGLLILFILAVYESARRFRG